MVSFCQSIDNRLIEGSGTPKRLNCELQISLNAHKNARAHYDQVCYRVSINRINQLINQLQKRWAQHKEQRTVDASKKALKSAKIRTDEALKLVCLLFD